MTARAQAVDPHAEIERMLRRSQTKVIFPIITLGLLLECKQRSKRVFADEEVRQAYEQAVGFLKEYLGHDLHIGGKYEDAYPSRNLPKYGVVRPLSDRRYELLPAYASKAESLISWIPEQVKRHISQKLGDVPLLASERFRADVAADPDRFASLIRAHIDRNPANFEVFTFAIMKVHLEKFACRIYRDTRTAAHDKGVDISTNFGVVYQIKKLRLLSQVAADRICRELKDNFDRQRLSDGNVIIIIDDISREVKDYLINMKVQSISKAEVLHLAEEFGDPEDRQKVLRIVYDEFRREYRSVVR